MKKSFWFIPWLLISCESKDPFETAAADQKMIEREVAEFHRALELVYNGRGMNTDSLIDEYFASDMYYVTYWGISEPIDTTKKRLRNAVGLVQNYDNQFENLTVKSYGEGAFAFFILRQDYQIGGRLVEEYMPTTWVLERMEGKWKVVHAQRSADLETLTHLMARAREG